MRRYADRETQSKLIDAFNIIRDYTSNKLPDGYIVIMTISSQKSGCELIDGSTSRIIARCEDGLVSAADALCVYAQDIEEEKGKQ